MHSRPIPGFYACSVQKRLALALLAGLLLASSALAACQRTASFAVPSEAPNAAGTSFPTATEAVPAAEEQPVLEIALAGPIAQAEAEISGMAWYSDTLVLLPQYPGRFESQGDGALFAIEKSELLAYLDGQAAGPITPRPIPIYMDGLEREIEGFEGFEALAFAGQRIYLTVEARSGVRYQGYLVSGAVGQGLSDIRLESDPQAEITAQAELANMSDEALLVAGQRLVTLYEANGANVNPSPVAHLFSFSLQIRETVPFPNIEYRITDVTAPDGAGRFWAINYFFPGDTKLKPADDQLAGRFGEGPTHSQYTVVERLVEFQFSEVGIILADKPPIQLGLIDDQNARNWEGLARLDDRGFLLATDKFPSTILGFVAYPE